MRENNDEELFLGTGEMGFFLLLTRHYSTQAVMCQSNLYRGDLLGSLDKVQYRRLQSLQNQ